MRTTLFRASCALLLLTVQAACTKDKPPEEQGTAAPAPPRPQALQDIAVLPASRQLDTTGAEGAERSTWLVGWPMDSVVAFYREYLPQSGWRVMNDLPDAGKRDLYLRKDTVALWLHIEAQAAGGTIYTFIATQAQDAQRERTP